MNRNEPTVKSRMDPLFRLIFVITLTILLIIALFAPSKAQDYQRNNQRYYKSHFRKQRSQFAKACDLLEKKRYKKPHKPLLAFNRKPKAKPAAEVDNTLASARTTQSTPAPKPVEPVAKKVPPNVKIEKISEEKLEVLHKNEDQVLANNHLPVPTSEQHQRIRKFVTDKIESKTNVYPLDLDPLYFNFDQDEFSVVDMEPFLMAAEYALQGRTVLIEGHTDNRGNDQYNVQLSIKRVQKIRQLMLDMGVPDERISVVGYGEEIGKHANTSSQGRQLNRRVDFTIF